MSMIQLYYFLVKDEETFSGWNTKSDGTGTRWTVDSTFSMGDKDITLYAIWLSYYVGDTGPAGGLVFYDKGSYSEGWKYLDLFQLYPLHSCC